MKKTIVNVLALAAYSALVLILVLNHEYWFDEAQAWSIARDNDIAGIFGLIKYEGHPPLWHLVLKPLTGLPPAALGLASWAIATLTAAVILFVMPIKGYLKAALLLSSGMFYINSVISRVYVLIMFILAVIAVVYPHRKKHPVVFGILIALLANTHIIVCGLVGIIGIYMLIDFFKDMKKNAPLQNIMNALGLAAAGCGVLLLVLPMLGVFETNKFAAERTYTPSSIFRGLIYAFPDVVTSGCSPNIPMIPGVLFSTAAQAMLLLVFVIMRRNRRGLVMLFTFAVFYIVITDVIWYTTPNRGSIFLYTIVMIYAMCRGEETAPRNGVKTPEKYGKLINLFFRLDSMPERSLPVLLAAVLFISVPSGVVYAVRDMLGEFTPYKSAAKFIDENIPSDALLVTHSDDYAVIAVYLPDRKIYSMDYNRFYTYYSHELIRDGYASDEESFSDIAKKYSEIYLITTADGKPNNGETVYENREFIPFVLTEDNIAITRIQVEDVAANS